MGKPLSLRDIALDLAAGLDGPELSWDIQIHARSGYFDVSLPITFYSKRQGWLESKVCDVAKKHGLGVTMTRFRSKADVVLEGTFSDIQMPKS